MSWLVLLRPRAEADLENARDWYEEKCPGLGDRFLDAVAAAMRDLESDPLTFRDYYSGFRRIVVFRVLHARQHRPTQLKDD